MVETVDWRTADPARVLHQVVQHWATGRLVVLPTEATYEASGSALVSAAVRQLGALVPPDETPALALASAAETFDWLPWLRGAARRCLRRLPPSQWRLQGSPGLAFGLLPRLPEEAQAVLAPDRHVTLRWPDLPLWWQALRMLQGPVASVPLERAGTAEQAAAALGTRDALVVDAGPCAGNLATLVRVTGQRWQVRQAGSLSAEQVAEAALCRIVFVCTGNTCRSPLAEALCIRLLTERLGCAPGELRQRGFLVQSAGLAAMIGDEAAADAVTTAQELGGDLARHRSQPLTYELFAQADFVFAMTSSHLAALQGVRVPGGGRAALLSPTGDDVVDPLGSERAVYQTCAREILEHLRQRLPEIVQAS
jgi:L-threonylcarbamoyladenylate synthase